VHFTVNRPVAPVFTLLAIANDLIADSPSAGSSNMCHAIDAQAHAARDAGNDRRDVAQADKHDARDVRHDSKHDAPSAPHKAHDRAFADDVDWLDSLSKDTRLK
jgi:hypothetical protein